MMTSNPNRTGVLRRTLLLLLAAAMTASAPGCTLRMSTGEKEAEESRQAEEANRAPETDPPETVPLNPPPPINGWNDTREPNEDSSENAPDAENPGNADADGPGEGKEDNGDIPTILAPYYTSALYEAGGKYWSYNAGQFSYTLPARDESGIWPVEEMYNIPRDPWSDAGDEWWPGSWSYDEATGVSTLLADRAPDALASVAARHAIYLGDTSRKVVYITFTAGFENGYTAACLDALKEKNAPAAFFVNGWYITSASDMVRRMLDEGHIVGNHCVNHYNVTELSLDDFMYEVQGLAEQFETAFPDAPQMIYFRPPSCYCTDWVLRFAEKLGYTTVLYSRTYRDYDESDQPDPAESLEKLKTTLHPGCVYYFHSISSTTAAILPDLIDWIRSQGYEILPICDVAP